MQEPPCCKNNGMMKVWFAAVDLLPFSGECCFWYLRFLMPSDSSIPLPYQIVSISISACSALSSAYLIPLTTKVRNESSGKAWANQQCTANRIYLLFAEIPLYYADWKKLIKGGWYPSVKIFKILPRHIINTMKDENKTKKQLINELIELRQSMSKLVRKKDEFKRLKKILPKTEELYHLFLENFQGIAFLGKLDFTPIFFKGAVEEITGYTEEEFLKGEPRWNQVIYPEDIARISQSLEAIRLKPRYQSEREYRIVRKDGQIRWIYELIQNICDSLGDPILVQGTLYDISERKRAEKALPESEDEYRSLLESTDDSIYLVDRHYKYVFMNKKHISRMGFSGNEYLGKEYSEFHSPDETKWFIERVSKVFNIGESVRR
jgi:PAS domain S-box-containing protein